MIKRLGWLLPLISPALSVAAATLFQAVPVYAQAGSDGFSFGIGGGFARASSSVRASTSPVVSGGFGYYVLSTLELPSPVRFVRPRADLFFAEWGEKVTALTANVLLTPLSSRRLAPYALAGAGAYKMPLSNPKAGWTLGVGLRLPGELRSVTVESRIHAYLGGRAPEFDSSRWRYLYAPIGLGVQF
ncbi:MAG: hypothetical protein M3O61_06095 [Gemmatimonadota bacterium]|nr:hypothetical protein [Gemmatimonadota bacterium]